MSGWPAWLDAIESTVVRDKTCPDCWWVEDGQVRFAKFGGEHCRHQVPPTT